MYDDGFEWATGDLFRIGSIAFSIPDRVRRSMDEAMYGSCGRAE